MTQKLTLLLKAAADGDSTAAEEVLPLVYGSLRRLAQNKMAKETPSHTLQPTALVHEAYLRLVKDASARWENRRHFFGAAAEAMRRILIERARRYKSVKHGGHLERVPYVEASIQDQERSEKLLALDEALEKLERKHPRKAKIVKLRYFVGLTIEETADAVGVSPATVKLDWSFARAWLLRETARITPVPASARMRSAGKKPG
ncbi:MAG: sigma-70 family RNA polymerase sigma factor [Candidatus Krumholzibacteriia bacterium]